MPVEMDQAEDIVQVRRDACTITWSVKFALWWIKFLYLRGRQPQPNFLVLMIKLIRKAALAITLRTKHKLRIRILPINKVRALVLQVAALGDLTPTAHSG